MHTFLLYLILYLPSVKDNYYSEAKHQQEFFSTYAKEKGFDPLDANQWYRIKPSDLRLQKVWSAFVSIHVKQKWMFLYAGSQISAGHL